MEQFQMKKLNRVILGAIISVVSLASYAGELQQVGNPSDSSYNTKKLKGFAKDLPIIKVMEQITPSGWMVKKNETADNKLDINKNVSWSGGSTWVETLGSIANNYDFNVLVNWESKTITLSNSTVAKVVEKEDSKKNLFVLEGSVEADKVSVQEAVVTPQTQEAVAQVTNVAPVAPVIAAPAQVAQSSWEMTAGKSLKENVVDWAEKSGYRLVWTGEDYPVTDARILAGDFDAEEGPIKQLSVDYGPDSRVQTPLSFQFYQNRTLVVENWMFEQTGYPQFNKKN